MRIRIILTLLVIALAACVSVFPSTATPSPEPSPVFTPSPGLIARGRVTFNDMGLEGVKIYRRFSAYPPELIAVTDENGYYETAFIPIPGDEMVTIEVELAGYTFDPPYYYWRHYHSHEETISNFAAVSGP